MNNAEQFFNMLGKNINENIYQLNNEFKQLNTTIKTAVKNPQQNLFFAVNDFPITGNKYILRQADKVRRFNACYVDIDLKNDQGEHLTDKDLQANKQDIYTKLLGLSCPPSAIIESRNGFHTYWIIAKADRKDCIPMRWRRLEGCIYSYIYNNVSTGADAKATDATRVLRLPNSYHVKQDNTSPFLVQVKYLSRCYTLVELEGFFPAVPKMDEPTKDKDKKQDKPQETRALTPACSDIYTAINELDSEYFDYIQPINMELGWQEAEKMLKWARVRQQALERDCYLCRLCLADGYINGDNLEVHHIIKIDENQELAYELGNLLTLCSSHHKQVEDDKGIRNYLRELAQTRPQL